MKKKAFAILSSAALLSSLLSAPASAAPHADKMKMNEQFDTPQHMIGTLTPSSSMKPKDVVFHYLNSNKDQFKFGTKAENAFKPLSTKTDSFGSTHFRFQQQYQGVPIFGYTQTAHVNKDGVLTSLFGTMIPDLDKQKNLKLTKRIAPAKAVTMAKDDLGFTPQDLETSSELVIYMDGTEANYAYLVNLNFLDQEPGNWNYFIDAVDGEILNKYNDLHTAQATGTGIGVLGDTKSLNMDYNGSKYYLEDNTRGATIKTYDMAHNDFTFLLPGDLWEDTDNSLNAAYDAAAVDAHYYAGVVYDFYYDAFGRNGIDGAGSPIISSVHYGNNYNNAFWNGSQMVYGDGDGTTFIELSGALDIAGHEMTHGVTSSSSNLVYQDEPGALSESLSDIFATAIEFYANNDPDWLMGEDVYTPGISIDALRSLEDPTDYSDPAHYSHRYTGTANNGGVHTNNGINNKAAHLIAEGGIHYSVIVTGIGVEKMAQIYYRANTVYLTSYSDFSDMRAAAILAAEDLYGTGSPEVQAVQDAYDAVGVY